MDCSWCKIMRDTQFFAGVTGIKPDSKRGAYDSHLTRIPLTYELAHQNPFQSLLVSVDRSIRRICQPTKPMQGMISLASLAVCAMFM